MGLIYHVAALPLYKNAADAKLENTSLSADVFIMGPKELFRFSEQFLRSIKPICPARSHIPVKSNDI